MTVLTFERVSVSFSPESGMGQALHNVSFDAPGGRMAGMWEAPSGVAASVVLQITGRNLRPASGRVLCRGTDIFSWRGRKTRIATLLPSNNLMRAARDVLGYVTWGALGRMPNRSAQIAAYEKLEWVGIRDKAAAMPTELSRADRVRMALAYTALVRPDVLLAADPAAAFGEGRDEILTLMRSYAEDEGLVVLISVRIRSDLRHCHDQMLFDGGRLVRASQQVEILVPRPS